MIRIFCLSRINLLSGRTHVYNLAKTCEALNAQEDFKVTFITTDKPSDLDTFFHKLGIKKPFDVICLGLAKTFELGALILANVHFAALLLSRRNQFDVVYFRDESLAPAAWWAKRILYKKVFFEIHSVLESTRRQLLNKWGAKTASGMIAISGGLKRYYDKFNNNIIVSLCSAAEDSWFDYARTKEEFRKELQLPQEAYLLGYTGVVGANPNNDYYEIDDIVKSLKFLPENIVLVIVGELNGNGEWLHKVARAEGVENRVIMMPWQERNKIPKYLQAFDINVIPKRKKDLIGDSPAKIFPALASQQPIIGGRAESIEEVLTDGVDAIIVEQNNPDGWIKAILEIYKDNDLGKKLSDEAWLTKNKYTWPKRGDAIGEFIKRSI
ncbi:MAG: glycosyltransferase [Minisyncoccia bacterium]